MESPEELRTLRTAGELRALVHPLRIRIMIYLGSHVGAATSASLARALGESTGAMSYHLRQLARYRYVEEVPGFGTARERGWRAVAGGLSFRPDSSADEETRAAQLALFASLVEHDNDLMAAFLRNRERYDPAWRDAGRFVNNVLHLRPEEVQEVSERIQDILAEYRRQDPADRPEGADRVYTVVRFIPAQDDKTTLGGLG